MTILMTTPKTIEQRVRTLRRWRLLFAVLSVVLLGAALLNLLDDHGATNVVAAGLAVPSSLLGAATVRRLTRGLAAIERQQRIMRRYRSESNGR